MLGVYIDQSRISRDWKLVSASVSSNIVAIARSLTGERELGSRLLECIPIQTSQNSVCRLFLAQNCRYKTVPPNNQ
jgi:hypothetical protein